VLLQLHNVQLHLQLQTTRRGYAFKFLGGKITAPF